MPDSAALTAADIARLAGVTRATVSNWRRRHADFPAPSGGTDASPAYSRDEVEAWLAARGTLRELSLDERLWRLVQEASDADDLGEVVAWAGEVLAAPSGGEVDREEPHLNAKTGISKHHGLLHALTKAARTSDPADILDSLIARYAEAGGGRVSVTAPPIAELMAAIAAPGQGIALDPACGTGELLAAAARHGASSLFGQELDDSLARLAGIRLAISDRKFDSRVSAGDSLRGDEFSGLAADVVLCHPPFGVRDWGHEELALDPRWEYGAPPKAEPELAWAQHAVTHLRPGGRAVLLMPPAAAGRASGRRIRAEMLRRGVIKSVIALAPGAIYPRHVGAHLWVLERPRAAVASPCVLLIDTAPDDVALSAWRSFAAEEQSDGAEPGVWQSMPVIDLLDESVDLTPSRHVGARAMKSSPKEAAEAVDSSRARLKAMLAQLDAALPGGSWVLDGRQLRWREVNIGDLARNGMIHIDRVSSSARADEDIRISRGDVVLPVAASGPMAVQVVPDEEDGRVLPRGLYLIRPDHERIDPWFLAGFLSSPANIQQARYGTSTHRVDVRRMIVPLLPLSEQQRYGAAFRQLHDFTTATSQLAGLSNELTERLGALLTNGDADPGTGQQKLTMQTH
jgi:SAM-dependent methyltransferase